MIGQCFQDPVQQHTSRVPPAPPPLLGDERMEDRGRKRIDTPLDYLNSPLTPYCTG